MSQEVTNELIFRAVRLMAEFLKNEQGQSKGKKENPLMGTGPTVLNL